MGYNRELGMATGMQRRCLFPASFHRAQAARRTVKGGLYRLRTKIDETVLALLQLTLHDEIRAWKGIDFEVMDRLHEKGFILDPANKSKSVILTEQGLTKSKELFEALFGK